MSGEERLLPETSVGVGLVAGLHTLHVLVEVRDRDGHAVTRCGVDAELRAQWRAPTVEEALELLGPGATPCRRCVPA